MNNHKVIKNDFNEWKIQLNMYIKFFSLYNTRDTRTFNVWSRNEEIRLGNKTDDIVESLIINSLLNNYQKNNKF